MAIVIDTDCIDIVIDTGIVSWQNPNCREMINMPTIRTCAS